MSQRRFTRLTNGHSKSLKHHRAMQALFVAWYNFAPKNGALKGATPAMASKITDHVWTDQGTNRESGGGVSATPQLKWYAFRWQLFLKLASQAVRRTMKRIPVRFSLAAMFLGITAIALFLSYVDRRRQRIFREIDGLAENGFTVTLRDGWLSPIWLAALNEATFSYRNAGPDTIEINSKIYDARERMKRDRELIKRLRTLGVEKFSVERNGKIVGVGSTYNRLLGN